MNLLYIQYDKTNLLIEFVYNLLSLKSSMSWFVAHSKPRCELKARDYFKNKGVKSYVPVFEDERQWSDRTKKVLTPAITGYVFFELKTLDYSFINLNPFLKNVIRHFGQAVEVKQNEIETMKECLKQYSECLSLEPGESVKILSGLLKNKKGVVEGIGNGYLILFIYSTKVMLSLNNTTLVHVY